MTLGRVSSVLRSVARCYGTEGVRLYSKAATSWVIPPPRQPTLSVVGESGLFPVRRVYCLCINFPEVLWYQHQKDSQFRTAPLSGPPFFFGKPADAIVDCSTPNATVPYPPCTQSLHYEIEQVVALKEGGSNISKKDAMKKVFGYAVGVDLTRRDLQRQALDLKRPWDMSKAFDFSGPCSAIVPAEKAGATDDEGRMDGELWLKVNDVPRQRSNTKSYVWSVPETISHLSEMVKLAPGDLIFMGTPHGWGPIVPGDVIEGGLNGVTTIKFKVV